MLVVAALVVAGAGCSSDPAADVERAAAGGPGAAGPQPEEVAVSLVREEGSSGTATVGTAGGSVAATSADGTAYELVVPPGALAGDVEVTVAPLLRMEGLPDGFTLSFGADLAPDGVTFLRPAWLFVRPAGEVDVATGLRVHDDLASLAPVGFDGDRYVLPIGRFSGAGAGFPGPGGGWPGLPGGGSSGGGFGGPPGSFGGGPVDVPRGGFPPPAPGGSEVPGPGSGSPDSGGGGTGSGPSLVPDGGGPAGGDDLMGELGEVIEDLGDAQLRGDEAAEEEAQKRLDEVKEKIKDEVWEQADRCVNGKDVRALSELVHWLAAGQLLGFEVDDEEAATLTSLVDVCNRFEVEVHGELMMDFGGGTFVFGDSLDLTVPLEPEGLAGYTGSASGPLDPVGYDRGVEVLEVLGWGLGAVMGVDVPNSIERNDHMQCPVTPPQGRITALGTGFFDPAGPTVHLGLEKVADATVQCPDPIGAFPMEPMSVETGFLVELGFPGATELGVTFRDGWQVDPGGRPFATTEVHHQVGEEGGVVTVGWHLVVNHAPGPLPTRPA